MHDCFLHYTYVVSDFCNSYFSFIFVAIFGNKLILIAIQLQWRWSYIDSAFLVHV